MPLFWTWTVELSKDCLLLFSYWWKWLWCGWSWFYTRESTREPPLVKAAKHLNVFRSVFECVYVAAWKHYNSWHLSEFLLNEYYIFAHVFLLCSFVAHWANIWHILLTDCFHSCHSGIAFTCWGRSYADLPAHNAALRVTASYPEAVVGVGLQVSHSQPAASCCTSIQHSIPTWKQGVGRQ